MAGGRVNKERLSREKGKNNGIPERSSSRPCITQHGHKPSAWAHGYSRAICIFKVTPGVTPSLLMLLEDGSLVCGNLWHADSSNDASRNTCLVASDSVYFGLLAFSFPGPQADLNLKCYLPPGSSFPRYHPRTLLLQPLHVCSVPALTLLHKLLPRSLWDRHLRRQIGPQQMKDIPIHNSSFASETPPPPLATSV